MLPAILGGVVLGIGITIGERLGRKYVAPVVEEQVDIFIKSFEIWYSKCSSNIKEQYGEFVDSDKDDE